MVGSPGSENGQEDPFADETFQSRRRGGDSGSEGFAGSEIDEEEEEGEDLFGENMEQ